jgi:hypothetical protein
MEIFKERSKLISRIYKNKILLEVKQLRKHEKRWIDKKAKCILKIMKNGHRTSIPQGTMSDPLRYMHTLILKEEDVKNEKKHLKR